MSEQSGTLGCEVDRLEYDFNKRIGRLFMPKDNCCDMSGCVAMFERIDPHVKRIETFAAGKPDYDEAKWLDIIRKTWRKMSPRAHQFATGGGITLPEALVPLILKAIAEEEKK